MAGRRLQQRRIRRRLVRVHRELVSARAEVAVAEEQLDAFAAEADEARLRSLVSENRYDEQNSTIAERHREVMERALETSRQRVEELTEKERRLLDQVVI